MGEKKKKKKIGFVKRYVTVTRKRKSLQRFLKTSTFENIYNVHSTGALKDYLSFSFRSDYS